MVKSALFDDTDPSITYNGSWDVIGVLGTYAPEYNGTLHHTSDNSATVDIAFTGTGISIYGSIQYSEATGIPNSNYVLDQNGPIRFNASGSIHLPSSRDRAYTHLLLYESGPIADGSHTVKISLDGLSGNGPSYYLDYYTVEVADGADAKVVMVDDRDPSVLFGGTWANEGGFYEYDGTTRMPSQGATASFPFNGTELTVYGTLDSAYANQPILNFQIDSDASVNLTLPSSSGAQYHQPLFHAAGLPPNQIHTLTVKALATNAIFLDYFTYKTGGGSTSDGSNNGNNGGNSNNNGNGNGNSNGNNNNDNNNNSNNSNSNSNSNNNSNGDGDEKSKTNTGAIVGGTIGGVAILLLVVLGVLLVMKRRKSRQKKEGFEEAKHAESNPYNTYPPPLPSSYSNSTSNANANTNTTMTTPTNTTTSPNMTSATTNLTMAGLINNTFSPPPMYHGHSPPPSTAPSTSAYDGYEPAQDTRYQYDTRLLQ